MSSTVLSIRTDDQTKQTIASFAGSLGLSTSAFATAVLLQAVREQRVVLTPGLEPTPYLEKIIEEAEADYVAGRNITRTHSTKEAIAHLQSL